MERLGTLQSCHFYREHNIEVPCEDAARPGNIFIIYDSLLRFLGHWLGLAVASLGWLNCVGTVRHRLSQNCRH